MTSRSPLSLAPPEALPDERKKSCSSWRTYWRTRLVPTSPRVTPSGPWRRKGRRLSQPLSL
eukprot:6727633-Lingulodinium_polyedra.AAC.1